MLTLLGVLLAASPSRAAAFNVTSLADDGEPGELRSAITLANASPGSTIAFGVTGTIILAGALPQITASVAITGGDLIVVDGAGKYQPFSVNASGSSVTLSGLTIQNGCYSVANGYNGGGGIEILSGSVSLASCALINNVATGSGSGGGIWNAGSCFLTNCTLSGNSETGAEACGGAIANSGALTMSSCTIKGNSAENCGGGIQNSGGGTLSLTNCTVSNNSSGTAGGIENLGAATVTACTLAGNSATYGDGGAMVCANAGSATFTNCTFYGNSADGVGGALWTYSASAALTDCTMSANTAGLAGGGIYSNGSVLKLVNSILYGDNGEVIPDCYSSVNATSCDIEGGVGGLTGINDSGANMNVNPLLESLASNGGATQTIMLANGSPCVGAAIPLASPLTDQRGYTRPAAPSIGAWDNGTPPATMAATKATLQSLPNPSTYGEAVTFTATISPSVPDRETVNFYDGGTLIATATTAFSLATFKTTSLVSGSHTITATYPGDADFAASASNAVTQTVNSIGTGTAVSSSLNPANTASTVTFTATVTPSVPDGETVTFYDGGAAIGTAKTSNSVAVFTPLKLAIGIHSITATYAGDANLAGSTSSPTPQTIVQQGPSYPAGLNFFSCPYDYPGIALDTLIGYAGVKLAVFDTANFAYDVTPNGAASAVRLGVGYWARFPQAVIFSTQGAAASTSTPFAIALTAGWNMIGDPFTTSAPLTSLTFGKSAVSFSVATSGANAIVSPTFWSYVPSSNSYAAATSLDAQKAYWVYAYASTTMYVPGS